MKSNGDAKSPHCGAMKLIIKYLLIAIIKIIISVKQDRLK